MRITVARLRLGIVVLGCLLVLTLAGFFFYSRFRFRRFEKDLPGKLGVDIQQTANGFTYSQSSDGHTLYTIHASKLVQYKTGGHAALHDVDIKLYGPKGSNRVDRISGSEFDYDQQSGIAVAKGTVQIDLAGLGASDSSTPKDDGSSTNPDDKNPAPENNTIHVKTSGLTFNSKTGDATTDQHMEFELPKAAGSSMGASYNSKTGLLILDHQVEITTSSNGKEATVHAIHAEFLRDSYQGSLLSPVVDYQSEKSSADNALLHFRKDGSVESIESKGHVKVVSDDGTMVTSQSSETQLDAKSQPTREDVGGGVNFVSNKGNSSMHGTAIEGTLILGPDSMLQHAQFRNAVSFVEQIAQLPGDPKGNASRQVQASKLDVDFVPGEDQHAIAHKLLATGSAQANLHTIPSHGPQQLTNISGNELLATLDSDGRSITQLDGTGNTKIVDLAKDGSTNTSSGDRLHVTFAPPPAGQAKPKTQTADQAEASQVETAIQDGHVVLTQTPLKKDNEPQPATLTAWAAHSEYHSADQILHLTGSPRLDDGQSLQMSATAIDFHRDSGDATEEGSVKATYTQKKGAGGSPSGPGLGGDGPVHLTSARAQLNHDSGLSIFYGSPSTPARLWQGQNSVLAPVVELTQKPQTLKAHGAENDTAPVVSSNMVSALGPKHQPATVRIHSRTLFYSDDDRRADFKGSVTAQDPDGTIHSDQAQVFLTPASKGKQQEQTAVDHMIATGHVVVTQPGRKGLGEKLVYTADDGKYVLTGTGANPPRMEDQAKGTTTGAALIFNSQDDSVEVSGGQSSAVTQTRTTK
ncbi:LptA/OstA family protein [Silvibacterium acidisoli]|uniref:LptA/OstA family protein n=1 Tax=Acidobacteriaceae bacterium ZG23-2 TaxID=2883246 RepID=UPI00406D170F